MNILILGGTGAMGVHLTNILSEQGHHVFVTSRAKHTDQANIHFLQGDAHDSTFLQQCVKTNPFDAIVDFMIYSTAEFASRIDLLLSSARHYIFLSSARVYADTQPVIREDSPRLLDTCTDTSYLSTDEYALSKAREENLLYQSSHDNWTIIRPYITYSENRLQLGVLEKENWLYRAIHGLTIVFSEDIASKVTTLTYGYNVAQGIAAIIGKKEAWKQAFHITADECLTWQEIFELYLSVLENKAGIKPKIMMIRQNPRVNMPNSKWQVVVDRYYNRRFDNTKINKFVDTKSFVKPKEGLKLCLEKFLEHPHFNIKGWNEHALYDRIAGEWTPMREIPTWEHRIKYLLRRTILHK